LKKWWAIKIPKRVFIAENRNSKSVSEIGYMSTALMVNSYFNDQVKSIALNNTEGTSTVGVMAVGEYEFGTSQREYMTVVSGVLTVKLPAQNDWKTFVKGDTFIVEANQTFQLKVTEMTAYLCRYE
jgi:purine/pyrimidine-nucleoside phosphorylase